jgi:hypothetical protein
MRDDFEALSFWVVPDEVGSLDAWTSMVLDRKSTTYSQSGLSLDSRRDKSGDKRETV